MAQQALCVHIVLQEVTEARSPQTARESPPCGQGWSWKHL